MKRVLLVSLVLIAAGAGIAWRRSSRNALVVTEQSPIGAADGAVHPIAELRRPDGGHIDPNGVSAGVGLRVVAVSDSVVRLEMQSPVNPGERRLVVRYLGSSKEISVRFVADSSDRVGDGTPDFLRLNTAADRAAFRAWFTALADVAAALPRERLPREIDDCAALLRWCYRGALHAHDEAWQTTMPWMTPPPLSSIAQYAYPFTPLGAGLFRVRSGPYVAGNATDGSFAQFADARTLWRLNTFFVTRDVRSARPGDLLFYRQLEQASPYHSMILTGPAHEWAVYHTGPIGSGAGEVRRVTVEDLLHHPDSRWRPLPENSNFLGVYRWNILREDSR